ncbi:MAG: uracil-DNA glycosylase [Patescibacteria group bacterium]
MEPMTDTLEIIANEVVACTKCPLYKDAKNPVPGEGNPKAEIIFIGEAPGEKEDISGSPFVGAAGKFLEEMLGMIGYKRDDVFIANVVKHRPPNNRDPEENEIITCVPYLERQIRIIDPLLIVTLGRHSLNHFMPGEKISAAHGQPKRIVTADLNSYVALPLYHPAAALYRASQKELHIKDFEKIPLILKKIKMETKNNHADTANS